MTERPKIYDQRVMTYAQDKKYYGEVVNPTFSSQRANVACGDSLAISGIDKNGIIVEVKFCGAGCMISQAAAAMLLEDILGKSIEYALSLTIDNMKHMLGIELGFLRVQCAELPLRVLQDALKDKNIG